MLWWRLIFAVAILVPLLGLLVADHLYSGAAPGILLLPVGLLLALMATAEVLDLLSSEPLRPVSWCVYFGVSLIYLGTCAPLVWPLLGSEFPPDSALGKLGWPLAATTFAVVATLAAELARYKQPGGHIVRVALGVFVICYVGLSMSFVVQLRMFHSNEWGTAALVSTVLVVKMADTGAYAFGKFFGRRQISPRLSPKKTVEGGLGGLAVACVTAVVFFQFVVPWIVPDAVPAAWWRGLVFGIVIALAGMLGDLCESLLKRDVGRKDSSGWLRGLGGVLDVLDSLLIAAPVALFCWAAGLVGPRG